MNNTQIFHSHCATHQFDSKLESLDKAGFHVVTDYFFENVNGEKFISFCYYPKGDIDKVKFSPVKKSPSIEKLAKENLCDHSDHWI